MNWRVQYKSFLRSVIGMGKTLVLVSLVIVMATVSGLIYGSLFWNNKR